MDPYRSFIFHSRRCCHRRHHYSKCNCYLCSHMEKKNSNHHLFISLRLSSYHFSYFVYLFLVFCYRIWYFFFFVNFFPFLCSILASIQDRTHTHLFFLSRRKKAIWQSERPKKISRNVLPPYKMNEMSTVNVTLQKSTEKNRFQ